MPKLGKWHRRLRLLLWISAVSANRRLVGVLLMIDTHVCTDAGDDYLVLFVLYITGDSRV